MRHKPLSPEMAQQSSMLTHRLELALDVGAWALGYSEAVYDNNDTRMNFYKRLAKEQPDIFLSVSKLEGRIFSIIIDGVPNFSEEI